MAFNLDSISVLFSNHLKYELWNQQSATTKNQAFETACREINAFLFPAKIDESNLDHQAAVVEQIIFLLQKSTPGKSAGNLEIIAESQSIEGVGSCSVSYKPPDNSIYSFISPKAAFYLHIHGGNRLNRG